MAAPSTYLRYGNVTDTYFGVIADIDNDLLRSPDLVPVQGRAVFTPALPDGSPLLFTSAPFAATVMPITAVYDDQGRLTVDGVVGVRLIATDNPLETYTNWTWRVDFTVAVDGQDVTRNPFNFRLPTDATIDLVTVQPVGTVNGVPSTKGDKGDPGVGIKIRGILTGTGPSVLPTGYGAAQDGWVWRVRSADGSYDELWAWVWTGTAGSWVDIGPAIGSAVIDDSSHATDTTLSAAEIDARIAAALNAAQNYTSTALVNYSANDYERWQQADLSWPFRNAPTDRHVTWVGLSFPPIGNGYALPGMDSTELVKELPS